MKQIILLLLLMSAFSMTAQQMTTDRPDQTESSSTVGAGLFQIETGTIIESPNRYWNINTTLFRCGVSDNFELRAQTGVGRYFSDFNKDNYVFGVNDLILGLKYRLLQGPIEIAYLGHAHFPTGSKNISDGSFGSSHKIALSHAITENIGFGYNIGYDHFGKEDQGFTYAYVIGFSLVEKVGFFVELYGNADKFSDFNHNFDTGFTFSVSENIQLDVSTGMGLNEEMNFFATGLSWRLPK